MKNSVISTLMLVGASNAQNEEFAYQYSYLPSYDYGDDDEAANAYQYSYLPTYDYGEDAASAY